MKIFSEVHIGIYHYFVYVVLSTLIPKLFVIHTIMLLIYIVKNLKLKYTEEGTKIR